MKTQTAQRYLVFPLALILIGHVNGDEATVQRFKKEAPIAWREIARAYEGTSYSVVRFESENRRLPGDVVCFQLRDEFRIDRSIVDKGKTLKNVLLANKDYVASAADSIGNGAMFIEFLESRPTSTFPQTSFPIISVTDMRPSLSAGPIYLPTSFVGIGDFPKQSKGGLFVRDAEIAHDRNGEEVVRLVLESALLNDEGEYVPVTKLDGSSKFSELVLAPHRKWCMVRFNTSVKAGTGSNLVEGICTESLEFDSGGFHPKRKNTEITFSMHSEKRTIEYSPFSKVDLADDFFRLTSLGLMEPEEFVQKDKYSFLTKLAMGFAFLSIGIGFYWRFKRRK